MKIALLSFYSGHLNRGVETYVDQFADQLGKNHTVEVYQSGPAPKNKSYPILVFPVHSPKIWPDDFLSPRHLLKRLFLDYYKRKELIFFFKTLPNLISGNYDIIYPTNSGWPIPILRLITFLTRSKLIIAGHSGPGWDEHWNLFWKPDLFICFTKAQLKWAKQSTFWGKQAFAQIYHAVDTEKFSPQGKTAKLKLQKPIVINVAASTRDKRVEQGIAAIARLKQGSYLLLGKGPLDKRINNLGYKLLGKNRFLHLSVSHDEIPNYYRAADLFTFCPHVREAFGLVYLEALACNLPVVATNDPIRKEIIGPAGLYINDPDDTDLYSQTIAAALKKNWRHLPQTRSQFFSLASVFSQYEIALKNLTK